MWLDLRCSLSVREEFDSCVATLYFSLFIFGGFSCYGTDFSVHAEEKETLLESHCVNLKTYPKLDL